MVPITGGGNHMAVATRCPERECNHKKGIS
jgi:hypothetical protein